MAEPTADATATPSSISSNAYAVAKGSDDARADIMTQIRTSMETNATSGSDVSAVTVKLEGTPNVDITTGAGALLLDATLQKLGTQEQVAGQVLSSSNRSAKEMPSPLRA